MEFITVNPDSTDSFYRKNMQYSICTHCELNTTCEKPEGYPLITPLSRWLIRWFHELRAGREYPYGRTWEDQPNWFHEQMGLIGQAMERAEQIKAEAEQQRANARQGSR